MKRRTAVTVKPKKLYLTETGIERIQAWADQHEISFSAAMESLALIGLGEAPEVALAPAIISTIRQTIQGEQERLVRLIIHNTVETGIAARMASAAVSYQRKDEPGVYGRILDKAREMSRRNLAREKIGAVLRELDVLLAEEGPAAAGEPTAGAEEKQEEQPNPEAAES